MAIKKKYSSILKLFGVFQFLYCTNALFIMSIIVMNGILCHGSCNLKYHLFFKKIDIITNIFLTLYINLFSEWVPYTQICSLILLSMWQINNHYLNKNPFIHILGVQMPSCITLAHF